MGVSFGMSVLPIDERGDVVLEHVREPSYSVHDTWLWELIDDELRPFRDIVAAGLELAWFRRPSMQRCIDERRNPERRDCFYPSAVAQDITTMLDRLSDSNARLPRSFRLFRSDRLYGPAGSSWVFVDGRLFYLSAGWGFCKASHWDPEWEKRPSSEQVMDLLHGRQPDVRLDLEDRAAFDCHEIVGTGDDRRPGEPITFFIESVSCEEHFAQFLRPMLKFCDDARAGGYVVFTSRS